MFNVIYMDPPWSYRDKAGKRGADKHYDVMSMGELTLLDIPSIAAKDAALLMWATQPMLPDALRLIKAYGFEYKTVAFTWIKRTVNQKLFWGMGSFTRSNAEVVLLGTRGKLKRASAAVHSVVEAQIGEHSVKPVEVMSRIEQLYGEVSRVELFARQTRPGWVSLGMGIDGCDIRAEIARLSGVNDNLRRLKERLG